MQGGSHPGAAHAGCATDNSLWETPQAEPTSDSAATRAQQRMACLARTLEREVIPRLAAAHRLADHADACNDARSGVIEPAEIEGFTRLVMADAEPALAAAMAALRTRQLGSEAIMIDLFAPVARRLGELWVEDLCDFTAVTVGLGRLQRLMRELSPAFGTEVAHPPSGRRVLLVRAPGEQHTFGLSMVAEFFRRAGWEVVAGGAGADTDPITAVRREWFDVVGFSVGSEARLDWLPGCIAAVRSASCNRGLPILVGGPVFFLKPQLARQVGADASAPDGSEAPAVAEGCIAGRVKRY
jgi:MerR family transcriptional regulator, light-induced transcriptional regulator